jgi:predicted NBD/HSP70 family sugar kinase
MSAATVTRIITPLMQQGVLVQTDRLAKNREQRGKPAYLLDVVGSHAEFAGFKVTGDHVFGVLTDLSGLSIGQIDTPIVHRSPDAVADTIADMVGVLRREHPVSGVGVSIGGQVSPEGVVLRSGILSWTNVDLRQLVEDRLPAPVTVSNDVGAFAQAESWWGQARRYHSFVLVTMGAGLGCRIVVDGVVQEGAHGWAGSIGHVPIAATGPVCEMGHVGCLRAFASTEGILSSLRLRTGSESTFPEFLRQAALGASPQVDIARDAARAVGRVVGIVAAIVDPDAVIVSGEGVGVVEIERRAFDEEVARSRHWMSGTETVHVQEIDFYAWARGAAAVAVDEWTRRLE